jgi:hypothetical protein
MDSSSPNHTVDNDETQLDQIAAVLEQLPEKTKSLRERVTYLRSSIQETLDKGYSYAEVATLLKQEGILISVSTLKQYMKRSAIAIEESPDELRTYALTDMAKSGSDSCDFGEIIVNEFPNQGIE